MAALHPYTTRNHRRSRPPSYTTLRFGDVALEDRVDRPQGVGDPCRSTPNSVVDHLVSGRSWSAGCEHASALTSATSTGVNTRGRPGRGRSSSPSRRSRQKRCRQRRAVSSHTPTSRAIAAFASPSASGEHDPGPQHLTVWTTRGVRAAGQLVAFFVSEDDDISAGGRHIHF